MSVFEDETEGMSKLLSTMMSDLTEPVANLVRAIFAATTDGLIDARARFVAADWPEETTDRVLVGMATKVMEQVEKTMHANSSTSS